MIVDQSQLEQITSKIRRRTIQLPVRYGSFGELKRCPLREGGVYRLTAQIPYERYLAQAERKQPKEGVLWLIDQCEIKPKTVQITVVEVKQDGDRWRIRFEKGERTELLDRPRLLAARPGAPHGDYVTSSSRALRGTADEVSEQCLASYAAKSGETYGNVLAGRKKLLDGVIREIKAEGGSERNRRLRAAQRKIKEPGSPFDRIS